MSKKKQRSFSLTYQQCQWLGREAERLGISESDVVRRVIDEHRSKNDSARRIIGDHLERGETKP